MGLVPRFFRSNALKVAVSPASAFRVGITTDIMGATYSGQEEMLQDLKSQVFPDRTIKYLGMADGKTGVREV